MERTYGIEKIIDLDNIPGIFSDDKAAAEKANAARRFAFDFVNSNERKACHFVFNFFLAKLNAETATWEDVEAISKKVDDICAPDKNHCGERFIKRIKMTRSVKELVEAAVCDQVPLVRMFTDELTALEVLAIVSMDVQPYLYL